MELLIVFAISLGFFVQTVFGFAATMLALPLLLIALPLTDAVALMSVFLFLFSCILIPKYWRDMDKRVMFELLISLVVGLVVGILILKYSNPIVLKKGLGVVILLYVCHRQFSKKRIKVFDRFGMLFGFAGGVFSGMYNTGGPIVAAYVSNLKMSGKVFRSTMIGIFGATNLPRVPILAYHGLLTIDIFVQSLVAMPFFFLVLYLGHRCYGKLNEKWFMRCIMCLLFVSSVMLIVK